MNKNQIRQVYRDEIDDLKWHLASSHPQAKYAYETTRYQLIRDFGYNTFFDIQSCAFEDLFGKVS